MSLVRCRDTKPEMLVRGFLHALGYRYRLHVKSLPGTPDLVFVARRKAVFIHGCFWHQHKCAMGDRLPKSRKRFWRTKLMGNKKRDRVKRRALRALGWRVLTVWECGLQPRTLRRTLARLVAFLETP